MKWVLMAGVYRVESSTEGQICLQLWELMQSLILCEYNAIFFTTPHHLFEDRPLACPLALPFP